MNFRLIIFSFLLTAFTTVLQAQITVHLKEIPASTPQGADIYFAGTINQWSLADENFKFKINSDGEYWLQFSFTSKRMEFKFNRGSWENAEGNAKGTFRPNRVHTFADGDTLQVSILTWEDLFTGSPVVASTANAQVSILDSAMYMPQLDRYRKLWLYLPQDYHTTDKSYPVLYMHDGQNVFDFKTAYAGEWQVDESLTELENEGYQSAIVVAIDNGLNKRRLDEYSPFVNKEYGGGEGDAYLDFIVKTLKPKVDAMFRTLPEPENTGIMGSSMGGLISHYAHFKHPDVFGRIGAFSPSYWFSEKFFEHTVESGKNGSPKIYLLAGELEGIIAENARDMYGSLSNIGFTSRELVLDIESDGRHAEWFWAREFKEAFQWLFNTEQITGLNDSIESDISIYPNPTTGIVHIVGEGLMNLNLFDLQGKLLKQFSVKDEGKINLNSFSGKLLIIEAERNGKKRLYRIARE